MSPCEFPPLRQVRTAASSLPRRRVAIIGLGLLLYLSGPLAAESLSDAALEEIRDGFEERRDTYLRGYLDEPFFELNGPIDACREHLAKASWIWHSDEKATSAAPLGVRYFRRRVSIPAGRTLKTAHCAISADDFCDLSVNGKIVGRPGGFQRANFIEITSALNATENVVASATHNAGDAPNPAGFLGIVYLTFEDGSTQLITTDESWRVSETLEPDWDLPTFVDEAWDPAEVLGAAGCAPWGAITLPREVPVTQYAFSRLSFALAALHLNTKLDEANAAIIQAVDQIHQEQQSTGEFGLHWMGGSFFRIQGLFGSGGAMEGRLSPEADDAIWQLFAGWARSASRLSDADPELTWRLWGSENHSAQRDATLWSTAQMLASDPRGKDYHYDDGSTPEAQRVAWDAFLKRYFRERVRRGMLIEISPSGYGSRTLQGWHNIYDFTDDPELKGLVKAALDVWWADWAQEQLGGMRGGGKTRLYPGAWALTAHDRNRAMSWFYLGLGAPANHHENLPVIATTTYRLPLVVMDIALDPEGRGDYEACSRRLGRHRDYAASLALSKPNEPVYDVDSDYGGMVKYSYCTPDFIMGSLMLENRPQEYWTAISQQNRWHGIIFAGNQDSTLYPRCETDRSTYNAHWAIQDKGTLIAQKLRHSDDAKDMRVCFSTDLVRHEEGGWIFAQAAQAFAAVKIVQGGWTWDDERWLRCDEAFTPIIFEVVRSQDFNGDFQAFQSAVLAQTLSFEGGVLRYRGLNGTSAFTFFAESDRTPELNGKPIDFAPDYAFKSPFLNEQWASGVVSIRKGERELTIDVRE